MGDQIDIDVEQEEDWKKNRFGGCYITLSLMIIIPIVCLFIWFCIKDTYYWKEMQIEIFNGDVSCDSFNSDFIVINCDEEDKECFKSDVIGIKFYNPSEYEKMWKILQPNDSISDHSYVVTGYLSRFSQDYSGYEGCSDIQGFEITAIKQIKPHAPDTAIWFYRSN